MNISFGDAVRKLNPGICGIAESILRARSGIENERTLHNQIFDECRRRGWVAFHGSMAERTHRTEGEPDFTILANRGRIFLIECKSKTGKLSPPQTALIHHASNLGHTVHVIRTIVAFRTLVDG